MFSTGTNWKNIIVLGHKLPFYILILPFYIFYILDGVVNENLVGRFAKK